MFLQFHFFSEKKNEIVLFPLQNLKIYKTNNQ